MTFWSDENIMVASTPCTYSLFLTGLRSPGHVVLAELNFPQLKQWTLVSLRQSQPLGLRLFVQNWGQDQSYIHNGLLDSSLILQLTGEAIPFFFLLEVNENFIGPFIQPASLDHQKGTAWELQGCGAKKQKGNGSWSHCLRPG